MADPEMSRENRAVRFAKLQRTPWDFKSDARKYFDFFLSANEKTREELTGRQAKNIICRHLQHLPAQVMLQFNKMRLDFC